MERAALVGRQSIGDGPGDGVVVDDSGGRDVEGRDSCDVWFDRADLVDTEGCVVHAVGRSSLSREAQPGELGLIGSDDELPGAIEGEAVSGAVVLEGRSTADAEAGLEAVRRVVEPAVRDPGVPAALWCLATSRSFSRSAILDPLGPEQGPPRHREPHDAAADHHQTAPEGREDAFRHPSERGDGPKRPASGSSSLQRQAIPSALTFCLAGAYMT